MTHIIPHPMQLFSWLQNTILKVHIGTISDAYGHMKREVWTLIPTPLFVPWTVTTIGGFIKP